MGSLAFIRDVYTLDTLDTRFTSSSAAPYQTSIDARSDPVTRNLPGDKWESKAPRSKWNTQEFYLYYVGSAVMIVGIFMATASVSTPTDPRYPKFQRYISDGWIPGRKFDNSDPQYHTFRENLPYMTALLVFHPLLRRAWNTVRSAPGRIVESGTARLDQRASFDYIFAILFLFVLHGVSAFKVLLILWLNYQVATKVPRKYVPAATWIFNIGTLFANDIYSGYRFRTMASYISPPHVLQKGAPGIIVDSSLMQWGVSLDSYGGLMSRWEILFNITILRLISFNMDYYWSLDRYKTSAVEKKQLDPANLSERDRVSIPADAKDYSFRNYVAYTIYAPLYLTGPILTFNDYVSQAKYRAASIERPRTIRYGVRFLGTLLAMEVVLHYCFVGAISKGNPAWHEYTAAQLGLLSFFNLHIIWLKLLLPWRLFRLWALVDGIDPPENMVRCVNNNYSTQMFWRSWHRSYNRWLIRYIYGPLGGASFRTWQSSLRSVTTLLVVFSFVAGWHDIKLNLLIWGWLIVLFMIPEWTAAYLFPKHKWEARPTQYRLLCGVGALINVMMMVTANVVGFAIGLDGIAAVIRRILHDWSGLLFITLALSSLFCAVQVMFEVREAEKRKGIFIKC